MNILGIETSCDETAVCLLEADGAFGDGFNFRILGNALLSQAALHAQYGGVFPNLAKREHSKNLVPLLEKVLKDAQDLKPADMIYHINESILEREPELLERLKPFLASYRKPAVDAIAVTVGPGLEPALWVGINFAKALSAVWQVPLVAVNHMEGHIVMPLMEHSQIPKSMRVSGNLREFGWPLLSLLISGGHTELVFSESFGQYKLIGQTRDDAAGEAFDKVARLMDLPYPGGPEISTLASEARIAGLEPLVRFTPPLLKSADYDFSFSGLKTEARKLIERHSPLSAENKMRIALALENCIAEVLVYKTMRAIEEFGARSLVVGGGVSANAFIREELKKALAKTDSSAQLLMPEPSLATDNALMIALAGYFRAERDTFADASSMEARGNMKLENGA